MTSPKSKINLNTISDEDLLNVRISDLSITIEGTWLQDCIEELYKELEAKGIVFRPVCYLADEWLTPQDETCIGIPFYLAHPTLIRLEKKLMIDAEGETKQWCMKLLRHEAGHAICYAYKFHKRKSWQRKFGPSTVNYSDTYKYRPYSKNYVHHLDGYYAQYHPDEDFVETFAVWLTPGLEWDKQYAGWRALGKLKFVDKLMTGIQGKQPIVKSSQKYWRLSTLRLTLKNYYKRKRHFWAEDFPDFHDAFLVKIFQEPNDENAKSLRAHELLRKYRKQILSSVSKYSGERKYVINDLWRDIHKRSKEMKLLAVDDETSIAIKLSSYMTTLIMNYLYTGKFRGEKKKKK